MSLAKDCIILFEINRKTSCRMNCKYSVKRSRSKDWFVSWLVWILNRDSPRRMGTSLKRLAMMLSCTSVVHDATDRLNTKFHWTMLRSHILLLAVNVCLTYFMVTICGVVREKSIEEVVDTRRILWCFVMMFFVREEGWYPIHSSSIVPPILLQDSKVNVKSERSCLPYIPTVRLKIIADDRSVFQMDVMSCSPPNVCIF